MTDIYGGKRVLNLPGHESVAAISAEFNRRNSDHFHEIVISDCNRSISLSINTRSQAEVLNSLYKIDTILEVLKHYRRGVVLDAKSRGYAVKPEDLTDT